MGRLFHTELVTVAPLARAAQRADALGGEPYARISRSSSVQVLAQVEEDDRNRRSPGQGGAVVSQGGTLVFERAALEAAGYTPTAGDMITAIAHRDGTGSRPVRWYVQAVRFSGKRPRGRRADLVICPFGPRSPSRNQEEGL